MSNSADAPAWKYHPALDGLRMLAVVAIVVFHAGVAGAENLFIGVDVFFVLSGFLVTNVIMSEIDTEGTLRLSRFWARRVRRLLPAAVVTVVLTCFVFVLVASLPERLDFVRQAQAALLYVANWQFIAEARDYFATDAAHSPFMHFWSLSVEEQFYLFFPLLVLLVHRLAPRRERVMVGVFLVVAAGSLVSQVVAARRDPTFAYFATDARLYQLMVGAIAALVLRRLARRTGDTTVRWSRAGGPLATAGLVGLAAVGAQALALSVSTVGMLATVSSIALVTGMYAAPGSLPARAFALRTPVYLGKISYGIYLFHYPVILVLEQVLDVRPLVVAAMGGVLAAALAALSYQLVELPIRRSTLLDAFRWRTVATGLTVSVLAAGLVVGPVLTSERSPALADTRGTASPAATGEPWMKRPVPEGLDFAALSEEKGPDERWCTAKRAEQCVVVDGGQPHVMLVGDSHARMLAAGFIPLAKEHGFTLSTDIVLSCPWQLGVINATASPGAVESCKTARAELLATIKQLDVDVVVLAGLARSDVDGWQDKLVGLDGEPGPLHEMLYDGTVRTVRRIERTGAKVVIVKSVLGTGGYDKDGGNPLDCLARAKRLGDCAVYASVDVPVVDGYYDSLAVSDDAVATVDLGRIICPGGQVCAPVRRGRVVWRNHTHLTAGFVRMVRHRIWREVEDTGLVPAS